MNVIDFIRESAAVMVEERPDVYDHETAVEELSTCIDSLREDEESVTVVSFTSFMLLRTLEDGVEEFIFSRKLSGLILVEEEEDVRAFSYSPEVNLPHVTIMDMDDE